MIYELYCKLQFIIIGDCSTPNSPSCCTDALPCNENEGGCYSDSECVGDLICNQGDGEGDGNCPNEFPNDWDCCGKGKRWKHSELMCIMWKNYQFWNYFSDPANTDEAADDTIIQGTFWL